MKNKKLETATFGAGCFWGIEETFCTTKGVKGTTVGYMGGTLKNPTYENVCSDKTGHAEVVQMKFDPVEVLYKDLLSLFFKIHDPTTKNRQGSDIGSQYRSVIFYHTEAQKREAEIIKKDLEEKKRFEKPIVTQIVPAETFYKAEDYHQKYLAKQGQSMCHI